MANYYDVSRDYSTIRIKFSTIPKISSITNSNFELSENAATPIVMPFRNIDTAYDYDTVGRILTLRLNSLLKSNTNYQLTINDLTDAADRLIASEFFDFTTGVVIASSVLPPEQETVLIRDRSIRSHAFLAGNTILNPNPDFYIVSSSPEDQEVLVPSDTNAGRITIVFSVQPSMRFINSQYFKAQRKLVQRAPSRWETIDAQISLDANQPWVYVDFPSDDAVSVYNVSGHTYFANGYKYRVKISKNVSI